MKISHVLCKMLKYLEAMRKLIGDRLIEKGFLCRSMNGGQCSTSILLQEASSGSAKRYHTSRDRDYPV